MAKRMKTNPYIDHKIFTHNAGSKKRINVEPVIMRGGERLWLKTLSN